MKWIWTVLRPPRWEYDWDTQTHYNAPKWFRDKTLQVQYEALLAALEEKESR